MKASDLLEVYPPLHDQKANSRGHPPYFVVPQKVREDVNSLLEESDNAFVEFDESVRDYQKDLNLAALYSEFQDIGHSFEIIRVEVGETTEVCEYELRMFWSPDQAEINSNGEPKDLSNVYERMVFRGRSRGNIPSPDQSKQLMDLRRLDQPGWKDDWINTTNNIGNYWDTYEEISEIAGQDGYSESVLSFFP